jgi:phosphoribosylformylglycinamidine synthase
MDLYKCVIRITRKSGVLDPEGKAVFGALEKLGYKGIERVSTGKIYVIMLHAQDMQSVEKMLSEISYNVLSNPIIENYEIVSCEKAGEAK